MTLNDILTICKPSQMLNLVFDEKSDVWCAADMLVEICSDKVLARPIACIEAEDGNIVVRMKETKLVPKNEPIIREAEDVNEHGNNSAIWVYAYPEERMKDLGFTNNRKGWWCLHKSLPYDTSFNLQIAENLSDWQIDILDEEYGQPYDYQAIIMNNKTAGIPLAAMEVKEEVDKIMEDLVDKGIIHNWRVGDYI